MSEEKEVLQEKTANQKLKMTCSVVVLAALCIVEVYLMINYAYAYLPIAVVGIFILCVVYFIADFAFKLKKERDTLREKEYENLFKSEKISYVMMKQSFLEMAEILEEVRANSAFPVEELVKAQKGTAKVTIQRSKENATAIMNSNDKVIEHILSLEGNMKEISNLVKDGQSKDENASLQISEDILTKQKDILSSISEMKSSMKSEISRMGEDLESRMSEIKSTEVSTHVPKEEAVTVTEEGVVAQETVEESVIPQETVTEEPVIEPVIEEKPSMPDLSDPGHVMSPEEIAALLANM